VKLIIKHDDINVMWGICADIIHRSIKQLSTDWYSRKDLLDCSTENWPRRRNKFWVENIIVQRYSRQAADDLRQLAHPPAELHSY